MPLYNVKPDANYFQLFLKNPQVFGKHADRYVMKIIHVRKITDKDLKRLLDLGYIVVIK